VLRQKIVNPERPAARAAAAGGRGGATPATVIVKTLDGREIRGVRRNEDTFSLQMIDLAGQLRMFDKRRCIRRGREHVPAPAGLRTRFFRRDRELVAYLRTLRGAPGQDRDRAAGCPVASPTSGLRRRANRASHWPDVLG
jgi:hypothetical protein